MDAVLRHMLDMTGHRDHYLLELSILSAVWQMADARQARMLNLTEVDGLKYVVVRGWVNEHEIKVISDLEANNQNISPEPLSHMPALAHCLQTESGLAKARGDDGMHMLWLPIWVEGTATSVLEVCRTKAYSRHIADMLEGMVGVYRNFHSLLEYSERDSLTGLLNRKTFERHFSRAGHISNEMKRAHVGAGLPDQERRHIDDSKLEWLAVVDIDHFKLVNDNFGHLYGDEVLILVANLMNGIFREHDKIFRFGGEEFVILIHAASLKDVSVVVERFRSHVENYVFPQVGKITVSVGYTCFHPDESPVEVLGHADQALYYAKSNGRNRCCQYEQLVGQGKLTGSQALPTSPTEYF